MLSETEMKVVAMISTHANLSIKEQARLTGVKEHSYRHALQKCIQKELTVEFRQVNFGALGLQTFNLYFSLSYPLPDSAREVMCSDPRVVWLAENVSDFRYEVTFICRSTIELWNFCRSLAQKTGVALINPVWTIELGFIFYGDRFIAPQIGSTPIRIDLTLRQSGLDSLDYQIIDLLSSSSQQTTAGIAREVGQPQTSVDYRIKKLITEGIITHPLYSANPSSGFCAECQILLSFKALPADLHTRILSFCENNPNVFKLVSAFGGWSYKMLIKAETIAKLWDFKGLLEHKFGDILADAQLVTRRRVIRHSAAISSHPEL